MGRLLERLRNGEGLLSLLHVARALLLQGGEGWGGLQKAEPHSSASGS